MKDYKKILEGVVDIINITEKSDIGFTNICTYIGENCPELVESKDEMVRKELIEMIKEDWPGRSDVIAWIEKQKERNTNTHLPSFDEAQGTPIVKQGEKKPAEWTFEAKGWDKEQIQKCITWLQSLRPQNRWKPSTFQIEALESATENCAYSEYQDCLRELAKQLKELREE